MAMMPNPYPGQASSLPHAATMMHGAVGDAVLWLEKVPARADTATNDPHPRLAQKDQCFQPRVLPIAVGTTVDFPNLDPIFHNVFSASPIKRFDLGKYPRGHSKSVTFDRTGLVNVYCDIHSHMEAFVLVLPTHAFTQPAADGTFSLPPVPPGHYTLHVWHPDLHEFRREIEVGDGDLVLELGW
jgi:plastocyanin